MYLRTTTRRNQDGTTVEYIALAHNHWDPVRKRAKAEVLINFGRREEVDEEGLRRLVRSIKRFLGPEEEVQKSVFFSTADLLNLDVDLLLYDTTSTCFEMDEDDEEIAERDERWQAHQAGAGPEPRRPEPQVVNRPPLRMQGHSKDHRPDVPQVVIGMAETREGIPVRCWVFPGNTNDAETVKTVKESLSGWRLNRVVCAVDRGMVSDENLTELRKGGAHYVAG